MDVEETRGFPLISRGVQATGSGVVGLQKQACIASAFGESFTWYAMAECLPINCSNYGDFSIICC